MILVGHQPEYLPYIGFFAKVSLADVFMISDHLQYADKDYQNRNNIRGPDGKLLLTVPVLLRDNWRQRINEVTIVDGPWPKKHWKTIYHNYVRAPFFKAYAPRLEEIYSARWEKLVDLNVALIRSILEWLELSPRIELTSSFAFTEAKTALLIEMCRAVHADTFISGRGARDYVEPAAFEAAGIEHFFFEFVHPEYDQGGKPFLPNLSVLDLLFHLGPAAGEVVRRAARSSSLVAA